MSNLKANCCFTAASITRFDQCKPEAEPRVGEWQTCCSLQTENSDPQHNPILFLHKKCRATHSHHHLPSRTFGSEWNFGRKLLVLRGKLGASQHRIFISSLLFLSLALSLLLLSLPSLCSLLSLSLTLFLFLFTDRYGCNATFDTSLLFQWEQVADPNAPKCGHKMLHLVCRGPSVGPVPG